MKDGDDRLLMRSRGTLIALYRVPATVRQEPPLIALEFICVAIDIESETRAEVSAPVFPDKRVGGSFASQGRHEPLDTGRCAWTGRRTLLLFALVLCALDGRSS